MRHGAGERATLVFSFPKSRKVSQDGINIGLIGTWATAGLERGRAGGLSTGAIMSNLQGASVP
ncbi:hypothetical protein I603_0068 [Erythrobacter dokdonensis DSW-74]|uniref:Uncharacterized protein n=1 Tax=Erythrobacter dokdonensis DSW-74 TaxID=1300349 RepID=A0A1A7BKD0_9SPHN|nr:hypothetical protein I603_0068 [Erythrobacter dokdonensis DSW-74]